MGVPQETTRAQAQRLIDVNDPHDLAFWTVRFGCTRGQLRAAIKATDSTMPDAVEACLSTTWRSVSARRG